MSNDKKVTEFTIFRDTWLRGEGSDESALLRRKDSCQCCLGFYLEVCGTPRIDITDKLMPEEGFTPKEAQWLLRDLAVDTRAISEDGKALASVNDNQHWTDPDREAKIIEIFAKHNITVKFEERRSP